MRHQLLAMGNAKVIVPQNQGPSVGFKLYDPNLVSDPNVAFDLESTCATDKEAYDFMVHNAQWHRKLFLQRGKRDYLPTGLILLLALSMQKIIAMFIFREKKLSL